MIKNEKHFRSSKCTHENKNALRQTKKIFHVYVCVYKGLLCQKNWLLTNKQSNQKSKHAVNQVSY